MTRMEESNTALGKFTRAGRMLLFLSVVVAMLIPWLLCAGTLDDAPFRVVVPGSEWQIQDSTAQPMGKNVFLAAAISNTNTLLKSVVVKAV